jgi:D-glycero-D-manno-heptose 1,7-bisphosphate phosphatase
VQPKEPVRPTAHPLRNNPNAWVLLDRDGVINEEIPGAYIRSPEEWVAIPGSLEAIRRLCVAGLRVVVLTNQSGIGRGILDLAALEAIHTRLSDAVTHAGGEIAGIFFCPHHPDENCLCRKPRPGLIHQAEAALGCSLKHAPMVGDQLSDVLAAKKAGCQPILVRTGRGGELSLEDNALTDVPVYNDLSEAATAILAEYEGSPI